MISKSVSNRIYVAIVSLLLGIILIPVDESKVFGTFLIGLSIGIGLSIIGKIKGS